MKEENRHMLKHQPLVVYLFASVAQQLQRTSKSNNRPLLKQGNPKETLNRLFSIRDPLYRDVASVIVETDSRHPKTVANKVMDAIKKHLAAEV